MSYQYPDRISVQEYGEVEVNPLFAVIDLSIEGESLVFGDEAFKKCKEVAAFVSELEGISFPLENLSLENVAIQTSTGKILKSSQAKFTLKLANVELQTIPKILGIIANQKNIEILNLVYEFGNLSDQKTALYQKVCLTAKTQGEAIAAAFGVALISVYSMTPKWTEPSGDALNNKHAERGARLRKIDSMPRYEMEGLNFVTNYKGRLSLLLQVDFRVSEFNHPGSS